MITQRHFALLVMLLLLFSILFITETEVIYFDDPALLADYQRHIQALRSIKSAHEVILHEGLPHQTYESEYKTELEQRAHVAIGNFPFYVESLTLDTNDLKRIKRLFDCEITFKSATGAGKACGGFHPDYCLEWVVKDAKPCYCLLCFGCNEVRFYQSLRVLHCDFDDRIIEHELYSILCMYQKNRPQTEYHRKLIKWGKSFKQD